MHRVQHNRYAVYSMLRCIWHTVNAMTRKGFPSLHGSSNSFLSRLIFQQPLQLVSPHHTQLKNLPRSSLLTVTQSNNCTVHTVQAEKENRNSLFLHEKKMTKQKKLNQYLLYNFMSCYFYCILHSVKTKHWAKNPPFVQDFFFCKSSCLASFLWLCHRWSTTVTVRYVFNHATTRINVIFEDALKTWKPLCALFFSFVICYLYKFM